MHDLEQIAREVGNLSGQVPEKHWGEYVGRPVRQSSRRAEHSLRFAEVAAAFATEKTLGGVYAKTGISRYNIIRYYLNDPEFQALLRKTNEEVYLGVIREVREQAKSIQQRAAELAEESLDRMEELLHTSANEHIQFKVAQDLLDRDPRVSRTKRIEGTGLKVQIDVRTLSLAAAAAREIEGPGPGPDLGAILMSTPQPIPLPTVDPTPDPTPAPIEEPPPPPEGV